MLFLIDDGMERADLTRQEVDFVPVDLVLVLVILMLLVFDELCPHWLKLTRRRKEVLKLVYSSGLGVVVVVVLMMLLLLLIVVVLVSIG